MVYSNISGLADWYVAQLDAGDVYLASDIDVVREGVSRILFAGRPFELFREIEELAYELKREAIASYEAERTRLVERFDGSDVGRDRQSAAESIWSEIAIRDGPEIGTNGNLDRVIAQEMVRMDQKIAHDSNQGTTDLQRVGIGVDERVSETGEAGRASGGELALEYENGRAEGRQGNGNSMLHDGRPRDRKRWRRKVVDVWYGLKRTISTIRAKDKVEEHIEDVQEHLQQSLEVHQEVPLTKTIGETERAEIEALVEQIVMSEIAGIESGNYTAECDNEFSVRVE